MDTIFVLNTNRQVIDVLSNNGSNPSAPFFGDTYTSELDTGAESYEFTTINNARTNVTLEVGNYVLFKYNGKYKLFQIMETTDEHSEGKKLLTVYAEIAGMELRNDYCEPFTLEGNFINLLERVLQDTNWRVGTYSESLLYNIQSISYNEPKNVYSIIQENLATFGGVEIEFRVEFIGNQLAALLIDCYESGTRGNKKYRRFEYGKDVKGITRERNINDLATAVIGQGNNNLTFKDIEWSKNLGNPCDKPLQQNFVVDIDANDLWNNGGKYIKTVHKVDTDDAQTLLQECWDYLQEIKQPKFDYDVDLALVAEDYQDIGVGDTNYVLDFDYQPAILLEARVGKLELSFADPRDNKCTLTNYKELVSILQQPVDLNTVGNMIQSKFPIEGEDIAMGAIGEGHINVTYYQAIKTDIMSATLAEVGTLIADKADITDLTALNADIENLRATKAEIDDLNATNGNITNLTSQVGQIETVINNHFTGTDAQILNITAENTTFDNAVIKNAMIDTVSADKMNTGTLNTNNVNIESEDGGIKISGATQQFKDKEGHVRVQIGKDASGNFTFCLFSQDGVGILLDETGIKAGAVPDGLIVNDMVSDSANISGSKLDISSVITQINNNETTINSSHIKFDDTGQSLLVAFNQLKNQVDTIEEVTIGGDLSAVIEKVNTHTTQIGVMQGQISSLIENTTITKQDGTVVQLKDEYNSTKDTVNSHTTKIGSLETNYNKVSGDLASVTSKQSTLEQNLDEVSSTLTQTTKTANDAKTQSSTNKQTIDSMSTTLTSTTKTANDAKTQSSTNKQSIDSMSTTLTETTTTANNALNKATTAQQNLDGFKTTVSNTYTTKTDFNNLSIGGRNLLRNTDLVKSDSYTGNNTRLDTPIKWRNATSSDGSNLTRTRYQITDNNYIKNEMYGIKFTIGSTSTSATICQDNVTMVHDETYTMSCYAKALSGSNYKLMFQYGSSTNIKQLVTISTEWKQYSWTFTYDKSKFNDSLQTKIYFGVQGNSTEVSICGMKLETGNKATDWTPAPEDIDNKFTNYATKSALSEVKQTADSITSKVSSMKIGGGNLLMGTGFENVERHNISTVTYWNSWGTINTYEEKSESGKLKLYFPDEGTIGGIWQDIPISKIPKGTQLVISYDLSVQENVDMTYITAQCITSSGEKITIEDFLDSSGNAQYGYQYHVFTTPTDIDYDRIRILLTSHGNTSGSNGNYVVITLKGLMLEKGNTPTSWQNSYYDNENAISEVKQTADGINYSFRHSGVPNLLYNGNFVSGFDCWDANNPSGWGRVSNLERTYIVASSPGIGKTNYLIQTVPMNRYIRHITCSCKMHVSSEGSDGTTNPFRNLYLQIRKSDGNTIYLEKGVTNFDTWETVSLTCYVNANVTNIEVFCFTRDTTKTTHFAEVMLTEGDVVHEFSQAKCEMNYNSTTINTNGVTVYFDGDRGQGSSNLNYDGLTIYDSNGNKKAWFGNANSAYIDQISTNRINEPSVLKCASLRGCPYTIYVNPTATGDGSGRDTNNFANSITSALNYFRETYGNCHYAQDLRVYVCNGEYWQDAFISGWLGSGKLEIYLEPNVIWHGKFTVEECHKIVHIRTDREWGSNSGAIIYHDNPFYIRASNVQISSFRASSSSEHTGTFLEAWNSPNVVAEGCDIVNYHNVLGGWYSRFHLSDMRGAVTTIAWDFFSNDLIWKACCPILKSKDFNSTWNSRVDVGTSQTNSVWQPWTPEYVPPAQPAENWVQVEQTFWATDLHTAPEGSGSGTTARSGCWGQGNWSSYKAHRGWAGFEGVSSWCSGGRNFWAQITMHRLATKHGNYGAVPVPKFVQSDGSSWSCGQAFALDTTYTINLPWEVISRLVNGESNYLQLWAGKSTNDYSFYDNVSLRVVCEKNMV